MSRLCPALGRLAAAALLLALGPAVRSVNAQIAVDFDQDTYVVNGPGETIDIQVLIDGTASSEELDPVRRGLYSFAVRMDFNSTKATLVDVSNVQPTAELDFFNLSPGAYEVVQPAFGGVKGHIDQQVDPLEPYTLPLLASFTLTNLASAPDSYPLELAFFNTLGPNEQHFLDGQGAVLDGLIELGTARVIVVPESAGSCLMLLALLGAVGRMRRRNGCPGRV
jgi:hypothetical protein